MKYGNPRRFECWRWDDEFIYHAVDHGARRRQQRVLSIHRRPLAGAIPAGDRHRRGAVDASTCRRTIWSGSTRRAGRIRRARTPFRIACARGSSRGATPDPICASATRSSSSTSRTIRRRRARRTRAVFNRPRRRVVRWERSGFVDLFNRLGGPRVQMDRSVWCHACPTGTVSTSRRTKPDSRACRTIEDSWPSDLPSSGCGHARCVGRWHDTNDIGAQTTASGGVSGRAAGSWLVRGLEHDLGAGADDRRSDSCGDAVRAGAYRVRHPPRSPSARGLSAGRAERPGTRTRPARRCRSSSSAICAQRRMGNRSRLRDAVSRRQPAARRQPRLPRRGRRRTADARDARRLSDAATRV